MLQLSRNIVPAHDFAPVRYEDQNLDSSIAGYITSKLEDFKLQRQSIEETWLYCYAQYLNTRESRDLLKKRMFQIIGEAKENWGHNINTGKAYEVTETIVSYLLLSLFPNNQWLHLQAKTQGYQQLARIIREYMLDRLDQWRFYAEIEVYIRQLVIIGTSCMAVPWSDSSGQQAVKFETLNMFDVWVDVLEPNYEDSPLIRRVTKTRGQIIDLINKGRYKNMTDMDVVTLGSSDNFGDINRMNKDLQRMFRGVEVPAFSFNDKIALYEFWGDIILSDREYTNIRAVVCANRLIVFENNTYECGKPFIIDDYVKVVCQNYGMSPLQASLGLLTASNNTINQLLDGSELAVNPWYTVRRSASIDPTRTKLAPGEMLEVDEHDDVRPMQPPQNNFGLSVSNMITLETITEKNSGTVPLIGAGQPRGGERVTAEEIKAVVDAGGTRLSSIFRHIERFSVIAIMNKTYSNIRQFTKIEQQVTVQTSPDIVEYWVLEPNDFKAEWLIKVRGASFLIEQREYVDKRLQLLELANSSPEVAARVNIEQLILDLVTNWGFENPEIYIKQENAIPNQEEQITSVPPEEPVEDNTVQQMAGMAGEQALLNQIQADGGVNFLQQLTGQTYDNNAATISTGSPTTGI